MKLPFLSQKQEEKEFFLALILSEGEVRSILFEKSGEKLLILGAHKEEFDEPLDSLTPERLVELSDIVISEVEQKLPEGANLEKTIFAVPHRWIEGGKIIKDQLSKLKQLCDALKLTPIGFIVSIEAIIAYLHKKEGVPTSAIFVEIGKKHIALSLVKNGNILSVMEDEVEKSPLATVEKILSAQVELEVLPSKIILLNFEHAKKIQQTFLAHKWGKSLSFLHIPQVEVLDPEIESQAVISGVASQMGFSTQTDVSLDSAEKTKEAIEVASESQVKDIETEEEEEGENPKHEERKPIEEVVFAGESVGFLKGVDILKEPQKIEEPVIHDSQQEILHTPEVPIEEEHQGTASLAALARIRPSIPRISGVRFPTNINFLKGSPIILYLFIAVGAFIALIIGYYYIFERAQIVLVLDKKEVNKELAVAFSESRDTSKDPPIIHVKSKSVSVTGKEEKDATGKKETGEKAKGEITIYNKTENQKTFSKNSILSGPNQLSFTLNDDVSVASTSSFSTSFSSAKGKVTADKFGKEYNLPSGSNFQFDGISTANFFAKNDSAFSGGTKKEIKVVSADDVSALETKTIKSLTQKAIADAEGKKEGEEQILNSPLDYSFEQKSFSKKEGEEADSVSLAATISYKMGFYKKDDLSRLAKDVTSSDVPGDYTYSSKDSKIATNDIKTDKNGEVTGRLVFTSVFLPKVEQDNISTKLVGKSIGKAQDITHVKGVSDAQIALIRSLPFFPKILPFNKNNIDVITKLR